MPRSGSAGFALVTTLIVLTVLTLVVTSFLASMSSERKTAHAFGSAARAEFAAQAAVAEGIALLKTSFQSYPDSVTAWEDVEFNGTPVSMGTVLYYRDHRYITGDPKPFDPVHDLVFVRPLMSGATAQSADNKSGNLTVVDNTKPFADPDNSIDFNRARFPGDTQGWIGSPTTSAAAPLKVPVPWKELTSSGSNPKVIARYAYWVEDESFKVNANLAGSLARTGTTPGCSPTEVPFQGLLQTIESGTSNLDADAASVIDARNAFASQRFNEYRALNQVGNVPDLADTTKFEGTLFSGALNLSRSGAQRLNLNAVVVTSTDATTIHQQMGRIVQTIKNQLPDFGQRFYRLTADLNDRNVPANHQDIYLQKIAANIRDYIDTDSQPTIVNNDPPDYSIRTGSPTCGIEPIGSGTDGDNSVAAIGKENVPYLDEYACRVILHEFTPRAFPPAPTNPGAHFNFTLAYYFEFWNMTPKDISGADLAGPSGNNAFIKVYNLPGWDTGGGTPIPESHCDGITMAIPIDAVFPAGKATVVTSDTTPNKALLAGANAIIAPVVSGTATFSGTTYKYAGPIKIDGFSSKVNAFRVNMISRDPPNDYETRMVMGNNYGIIESQFALPLVRGDDSMGIPFQIHDDDAKQIESEAYFVRGGSLRGSGDAPSQFGDPRTNNEQLYFRTYVKGGTNDPDQTRYYESYLGNGFANIPAFSTLGKLNSNFVDPQTWPDPSSSVARPTNNCSPMVIANAPMKSIGELGHIFDPTRKVGSSVNILYSRGGGRTLTIGQPDPLWDGTSTSPSREWTAWRLTDIFSTTDDIQLKGRININGVARDQGAALKSALYGYTFTSGSNTQEDPQLANRPLTQDALNQLLQNISKHISDFGPYTERGQLSELPITGSTLAGINDSMLYDRGREELFRRLVELTTTRGNIFSLYAIGQSIQQTAAGKKVVTATYQMKVTFELDPQWQPALDLNSFDPGNANEVKSRFRAPDSYAVRILQVSTN